jgi:hypothetical protein
MADGGLCAWVHGKLDWGPLLGLGLKLLGGGSFVVCTRVAQEGPLTGRADAAEMNPEWWMLLT